MSTCPTNLILDILPEISLQVSKRIPSPSISKILSFCIWLAINPLITLSGCLRGIRAPTEIIILDSKGRPNFCFNSIFSLILTEVNKSLSTPLQIV